MARLAVVAVVAAALVGCVKRVDGGAPPAAAAARAVRLLADTADKETSANTQVRADLEFDTRDSGRTAFIVATGETPVLSADGAEARLFGDEAGSKGFEVDNCVLIEVLAVDGTVLNRGVAGYLDGLILGKEHVDILGPRQFRFEAGEISLAAILPERGPFKLRATVLDNGGVGRVTDVWLRIMPKARPAQDELRE